MPITMQQATEPSDVDAEGYSSPLCHIPLQHASCVICRFPIWLGETVAAVIGDWASPIFSAYTLSFVVPPHGHIARYTTAYERCRSSLWRLCRYPPCSRCLKQQDAFIYHVDCYHMVKRHGKQLTLRDIWAVGIWTQGLSQTRYQTRRHCSLAFLDDPVVGSDCLASSVRGLPWELRNMVVQHSLLSPLWRLLSAMCRRRIYDSLLDDKNVEEELPLGSIRFWDRDKGLFAGRSRSHRVRFYFDDLGVRRLEFADNSSQAPVKSHRDAWYVVEDVDDLKGLYLGVKGSYLRVKSPRTFQLWDTPDPPRLPLAWFEGRVPARIRSISLEGLTGLTVYCRGGAVYWIDPHFGGSEPADPLLRQDILHPDERRAYTGLFFPLAKGERIDGIWVRYLTTGVSCIDEAFAISTTFGRAQIFGKYENHIRYGISFQPLSNGRVTHLLLSDPDLVLPTRFFGATPPIPPGTPVVLPESLSRPRDPPDSDRLIYLSFASLRKVRQLRLFYRLATEASQLRTCEGILLEYLDGSSTALGICCGRSDGETVAFPTAIHFQYVPRGVIVKCSPPAADVSVPKGTEWQTKLMEGEIMWWFNNEETVRIE